MRNYALEIALLLALSLTVAGCASKAAPAKDAGFVESDKMQEDPSLPFHKVWIASEFQKGQYDQLFVAPVNTDYMLEQTHWPKDTPKAKIEEDIKQLAVYAREAIKKAFREDSTERFKIVNVATGEPRTLNVEVAITEVVPSKVALSVLGYVPFGIGFGINSVRRMADDLSSVAYEVRIRDAATGDTMAMFSDRNTQQSSIVSGNDLTWYGHAYSIIDNWAKKLVDVANRKPGEFVKDTSSFTLKAS